MSYAKQVWLYCDGRGADCQVDGDAMNAGMFHRTATEAREWAARKGAAYRRGLDLCPGCATQRKGLEG